MVICMSSTHVSINTLLQDMNAGVVNFFLVEAETRRRWDIFQAEVTLY